MTKSDLIKKLEPFADDAEVLVRSSYLLKKPRVTFEAINQGHFAQFPFYVSDLEVQAMVGKTVIIIE